LRVLHLRRVRHCSLLARKRGLQFLELGRSCVLPAFRKKRTLELLWHGIWAYVLMHRMDVMIGCASLEGTDTGRHAAALSFLYHQALAPAGWLVRAWEAGRVEMNLMGADEIDARAALRALPPLIKGYLRLGAFVGDGAVLDGAFGTTDVCIVLPVSEVNPRYVHHYGMYARRFAS
jgi:putative hemolysin